ncbi:MAG: hypothetical protein JWL97_4363, partial [Gemmatimonadales bacterium]|nr:hypothetical protein [Gemmatimonadales bacterium]
GGGAAPGGSKSGAFDRLHVEVQRWIWQQGWRELRDAQEAAVAPVLAGDTDVLISAATASGKTEAAFLPICSALVDQNAPQPSGISAVYLSPLKALINDQYQRLEDLCELLDIPVHRWHGDVPGSRKSRLLDRPDGILLITPESLEALFVTRGSRIASLFAGLQYVVIDELHSFIGGERGAQLQSLLHRLELAVRRRVPRIGLSATLGDMAAAAEFLRPQGGAKVHLISSTADGQELRLQLRGHLQSDPSQGIPTDDDTETGHAEVAFAEHLFRHLRGTDNLVFANSRTTVEQLTDRLTRLSEQARVPNEFVPHHGNLSKEIREHVESRLKDRSLPVTAICTSTLEMGIDIGSVTSVAQIGAPSAVSALRQRLGRSGRRGGPAILRLYVSEQEITGKTPPQDQLRAQLVQSVATVNLLLARWCEPPSSGGLHLSTLVQQILSMIAQHGGVTPLQAHQTLCAHGPFHHIDQNAFGALLRDLGTADLLRQERDGLLLHGEKGERLVNHYSFFAAFASPTEYRLVAEGRALGTFTPLAPPLPGGLMIFAGRRWKIRTVDTTAKVIELTSSTGGRPPGFSGGTGFSVHDRIRTEMRLVYESTDIPIYLDATAQRLLAEARDTYRRLGLAKNPIVGWGNDTLLFPFRGDTVMSALGLALHQRGIRHEQDGLALCLEHTNPEQLTDLLTELAAAPPPDSNELAALVPDKIIDKYDEMLGEQLLTLAYAKRKLDVAGAWETLPHLAAAARQSRPANTTPPRAPAPSKRHRIGELPYAVIDTETTGLDPLRDRIIEIAIIRLNPDGTTRRSLTTVLQGDGKPGPSHIHGIVAADLAGAPHFAEVAGDIARLIDGAVIVAHNAMFDTAMLTAEFARAGAVPDDLLSLCTLQLAQRYGSPTISLRLADCAVAEGIDLLHAHTAHADAHAAAQLLTRYLTRAQQQGAHWLDEIGAEGTLPTPGWAPWPPGGRTQTRTPRPGLPPRPPLLVPPFETQAATLYADLIARAATTPESFHTHIPALRDMATQLELDPRTRQTVHTGLAAAWGPHPAAKALLQALETS